VAYAGRCGERESSAFFATSFAFVDRLRRISLHCG